MDLGQACKCSRFVVDWETAFAKDYAIEGWVEQAADSSSSSSGRWVVLADAAAPQAGLASATSKQHVVHSLPVQRAAAPEEEVAAWVSKVKLTIRRPALRWGASVWRFQVLGTCAGDEAS